MTIVSRSRRPAARRWGISTAGLAVVALLIAPAPLQAQDSPLVMEARGGLSVPLASFRTGPDRGGEITNAPTFGVHFVYRGPSGWGPYVGFDQHRFDCADDGCPPHPGDASREYVDTNWDIGMQRTIGNFGWVRAGFLFGRVERDFVEGAGLARHASSLGAGVEGGAGLRVPIRGRLSLSPGARYGWLNTRFRDGDLVRLRWLTADVGVVLGF